MLDGVVLLTLVDYSVTTNKHLSWVRQSVTGELLRVPTLAFYASSDDALKTAIQADFAKHLGWKAQMVGSARKGSSQAKHYRIYAAYMETANAFCRRFDLPLFQMTGMEEVAETARKFDAARAEQDRIKQEAEATARRERNAKVIAEDLPRWLAGENVQLPGWDLPSDYLRLYGDREVQTSRGAVVPRADVCAFAQGLMRQARTCVANGVEYRESVPVKFGHYPFSHIEVDGTVVVGCHRFALSEVERFAAILKEVC